MISTTAGAHSWSQNIVIPEHSFALSGSVHDASGASVSNVSVSLIASSSAEPIRQSTTDANGMFFFANLTAGRYSIRLSVSGFWTRDIDSIQLDDSNTSPLTLSVPFGGKVSIVRESTAPSPGIQVALASSSECDTCLIQEEAVPLTKVSFSAPAWNSWAAADASANEFTPIRPRTGSTNSLIVALAALRYNSSQAGVYSSTVEPAFVQLLKDKREDAIPVDVIVNPDPLYYAPQDPSEVSHSMVIDLKRMRTALQSGFTMPKVPFDALRAANGNTEFNFGVTSFRFHTKFRTGWAPISLEIWSHDTGTPLTETTALLCIIDKPTDTCGNAPPSPPTADTLEGVDLSGRSTVPDAAIHISERTDGLVGVYRCNSIDCPDHDYHSWELGETSSWLITRLRQILTLLANSDFGDTSNALHEVKVWQAYANAGTRLFDTVLSSKDHDPRLIGIVRGFIDFQTKANMRAANHLSPPTLFVRVLSNKSDMILVPWDLMHIPGSDSTQFGDFIGASTYVETPLEAQDYHNTAQCISKWMLFIPPPRGVTDPTFDPLEVSPLLAVWQARDPFDAWIDRFKTSCPHCVTDDPHSFESWLRGETSQPIADAVITLSHHSTNSSTDALFFYSDRNGFPAQAVDAGSVQRSFANPSLVILDGCGTGLPGSSEFIRSFNSQGVNTILATALDVDSTLAGQFVARLMDKLATNSDSTDYTIGNARWDAIHELAPEYGPRALVFALAGNSGLRACVPKGTAAQPRR